MSPRTGRPKTDNPMNDRIYVRVTKAEKEEIKTILKQSMETAINLQVPLIADLSEATNWYDCK